jgi:hypothetical protein
LKSIFTLTRSFIFLTICLFSLLSLAGHEHGNGGGAIVCRDTQNQILSVELLDLWEARKLGKPLILGENLPTSELLSWAARQISQNNPLLGARVRNAIYANQEILTPIPTGTQLVPPIDTLHWMMEVGCRLESVAQYMSFPEGHQLFIDTSLFKKMPPLDQAALWLHEAIYKVLRENDQDQDSLRTRNFVTHAFSLEGLPVNSGFTFSCFQNLVNNTDYSFSMIGRSQAPEFRGWITRVNGKWQFPALAISAQKPEDEPQFLYYLNLKASDIPANSSLPAHFSMAWRFQVDRQIQVISTVLTPKIRPANGNVFNFTLFTEPDTRANCVFPHVSLPQR